MNSMLHVNVSNIFVHKRINEPKISVAQFFVHFASKNGLESFMVK